MAKVLLVEDDNNLREIYEARLQAEGYEIAAAQDGEQALVVAKDFKPDLVISDVMMPKISGFEMLDILRNTEGLKNTRVIMLTALSQAEDKQRADSLGADRYLVKSQVTLEDIIKAAHDILGDGSEPAASQPATAAPVAATDMAVTPTPQPATTPAEPTSIAVSEPATDTSEPVTVTTAASDTTAPSTAEAAIAEAVEAESSAADPAPTATPASNDQTKDDELLADAATSLNDSTGTAPDEPVATPDAPSAVKSSSTTDDDSSTGSSAGSSKRVIQPIDTDEDTKPTLEELLAREEAKEISGGSVTPTISNAPSQPTPDVTPPPAPGSTTAPGQSGDVNPHDIAL
jgi:CheY-like chemotaxis protein